MGHGGVARRRVGVTPLLGKRLARKPNDQPARGPRSSRMSAFSDCDVYGRFTSTPVVSLRKIPDFAAFPEVDIRAMVGVVKHAPRAFLFHQRLCQRCDCSGVLVTALSRSKHLPSARRLRWPQASTSTPPPAMSSSWAAGAENSRPYSSTSRGLPMAKNSRRRLRHR